MPSPSPANPSSSQLDNDSNNGGGGDGDDNNNIGRRQNSCCWCHNFFTKDGKMAELLGSSFSGTHAELIFSHSLYLIIGLVVAGFVSVSSMPSPSLANPFFQVVKQKAFDKFENTAEALSAATLLIDGKPSKGLRKFLKTHCPGETLAVADSKIGNTMKEKLISVLGPILVRNSHLNLEPGSIKVSRMKC